MISLTAVILTKNESKNIKDCIDSISKFASRICVIDSGSDDDTVNIARENGAEVFYHSFENYSKQFNWGLDNLNITTNWTLRIDADERFTPELCEELTHSLNNCSEEITGVTIEAWLYFMGKKLKFGGSKKRKLMIFKSNFGRIEDRKMDEHTILLSGEAISAKNKFIHFDFKSIDFFAKKLIWYSTREMQDYFDSQKTSTKKLNLSDKKIQKTRNKKFRIYYKLPLFIRSYLLFVYFYIFKLGFLDGVEGLIYNFMYHRVYRSIVDFKIYEQRKTQLPFTPTGDLKT